MAKLTSEATADGILKLAKEAGIENNALFLKTLERYMSLQAILDGLEESMAQDGLVVQKEYIKGVKNPQSSPAAREYTKFMDCANKTASTLMRIIKNASEGGSVKAKKDDDLITAINGGDDYGEENN